MVCCCEWGGIRRCWKCFGFQASLRGGVCYRAVQCVDARGLASIPPSAPTQTSRSRLFSVINQGAFTQVLAMGLKFYFWDSLGAVGSSLSFIHRAQLFTRLFPLISPGLLCVLCSRQSYILLQAFSKSRRIGWFHLMAQIIRSVYLLQWSNVFKSKGKKKPTTNTFFFLILKSILPM